MQTGKMDIEPMTMSDEDDSDDDLKESCFALTILLTISLVMFSQGHLQFAW